MVSYRYNFRSFLTHFLSFRHYRVQSCLIGYVDLTFKQSLYKQINHTEDFYWYVLLTEVMVKDMRHFGRRVSEITGIRTAAVMRGTLYWDISTKIVLILKIYLPFLRL